MGKNIIAKLIGEVESFDLSIEPNRRISFSIDLFKSKLSIFDDIREATKQGDKLKIIIKKNDNGKRNTRKISQNL